MKRFICGLVLFASFSAVAQQSNHEVLKTSLQMWQPIEIAENGDSITLITHSDQVTEDIYNSIVKFGICGPLWLDSKKTKYLKNIKEINVLNRFNYAGRVFLTPRDTCNTLAKTKDDKVNMIIAFHTHIY